MNREQKILRACYIVDHWDNRTTEAEKRELEQIKKDVGFKKLSEVADWKDGKFFVKKTK